MGGPRREKPLKEVHRDTAGLRSRVYCVGIQQSNPSSVKVEALPILWREGPYRFFEHLHRTAVGEQQFLQDGRLAYQCPLCTLRDGPQI